ncbi:MAG: hypothetical protein AAF585_19905, partial [Verrucomicrobiota bacterium]
MNEKFLNYRGKIQAIASHGSTLGFVTHHRENHATAIYRLDAESLELTAQQLPEGANAILSVGDDFWAAGTDGQLFHSPSSAAAPTAYLPGLGPGTALAALTDGRIAMLSGETIAIFDRSNGARVQTLALESSATTLASDPTGQWIAVGCQDGRVCVYECEGKERFESSASAKIHEGAVDALMFEPEELRFFSAGADGKLFTTHARGDLEPEDRGRTFGHEKTVTAIISAPGDRFITGSLDKTCKTWKRGGGSRPATLDDGLGKVIDLATIEIHGRTHLAAACSDNTIRFFLLGDEGKFGE